MSTKANMVNLVHVIALSVAMLFLALSTSHATETKESPKQQLSECPVAVQKTLTAEAKGAKITEALAQDVADYGCHERRHSREAGGAKFSRQFGHAKHATG